MQHYYEVTYNGNSTRIVELLAQCEDNDIQYASIDRITDGSENYDVKLEAAPDEYLDLEYNREFLVKHVEEIPMEYYYTVHHEGDWESDSEWQIFKTPVGSDWRTDGVIIDRCVCLYGEEHNKANVARYNEMCAWNGVDDWIGPR
jgi:hypothetical protein